MNFLRSLIISSVVLTACTPEATIIESPKDTIKLDIQNPPTIALDQYKDISAVATDGKVCISTDAFLKQISLVDQLTGRILVLQRNIELYKRYYEKKEADR